MNNSTVPTPFCHTLKSSPNNLTYCGITEKWEGRFSNGQLLAMMLVPMIIAVIILVVVLPFMGRYLLRKHMKIVEKENRDESQPENVVGLEIDEVPTQESTISNNQSVDVNETQMSEEIDGTTLNYCNGKCTCCNCVFNCVSNVISRVMSSFIVKYIEDHFPFVSFVVFPLLSLTWDTIDVGIDLYLFYQLEKGKLLDSVVFRNVYVSNAIYAFAVLGVVKLLLCVMWLWLFNGNADDHSNMKTTKLINYVTIYLLEDGGEMFLEYFYIEKYFTDQPSVLFFVRDVVLFVLAVYTVCDAVKWARDVRMSESTGWRRVSYITFVSCCVIVGVTNLLRVMGAGYQYTTSKLHRSCLGVVDGKLVQSPFKYGCLREIDYIILVLHFVPVLGIVVVIVSACKL